MGRIGVHLTEAARREILDLHGKGLSANAIAFRCGHSRETIARTIRRAAAPTPAAAPPEADPPASSTRAGRRDTQKMEWWRGKAQAAERELRHVEHLAEQLAGLRASPVTIPDWLISQRQGPTRKSVLGCLISDVHMGEVISAEETSGVNEFNPDICSRRFRRYFEAACAVGTRWAADTDCQGVLLALAGDLISGDIHEELRMTNALTAHEQVAAMVGEVVAAIRVLLRAFPAVHVVAVPGNHGRTTPKPTAKLYARASYDMLIASMAQERLSGDKRVTWQMSAATDQITPVFGRTVLTTHGDKIGTGGGQGFAGPVLPIVRGSKKIEAQMAGIGRRPDLIQFGHYHTSAHPGMIFANGSVPGYSEYANGLRASVEPPQQWLYLLQSHWWLRDVLKVQLEEPVLPPKPRVRIPAGWATA